MDADLFDSMDMALSGISDEESVMDDPFAFDDTPVQTDRQLQQPLRHNRRTARRRLLMNLKRRTLAELIPALPDPDEDIYIVSNGEGREGRMGATLTASGFDFGTFIPVLVKLLGNRACTCYCSTWVMNADHARQFVEMLDDGRLAALTVFSDPYFKAKPSTAPIANTLMLGLQRHAPRGRFLAWKNHTKILCLADADEQRFVTVTGSANLTAVQRAEQYVVSGSPDLYHFFVKEFFEAMLK